MDEYSSPYLSSSITLTPLGVKGGWEPGTRPDFLLWGDSHAIALAPAFDDVASRKGLSGIAFVHTSHVPLPGTWLPSEGSHEVQRIQRQEVVSFIQDSRPRRVVIAARWTAYLEGPSRAELSAGRQIDANWVASINEESSSKARSLNAIEAGLMSLAEICANSGSRLVIIRQIPECGLESPSRSAVNLAMGRISRLPRVPLTYGDFLARRASMDRVLDGIYRDNLTIIDPAPRFRSSTNGVCVFEDGMSNYRDDDHLSWTGLKLVVDDIVDALGLKPSGDH
jgi:hypothetical protein